MVEIVEYMPQWPERFEQLRGLYEAAFADAGVRVVAIEHVGSTAVPGLAAKPIIDVDIVVEQDQTRAATAVLVGLGFRPLGELGIPERYAFKEPVALAGTNTYVVINGSLALKNHLIARDTLRRDKSLRDEYGTVKRVVASHARDIFEYGQGKNSMIQNILKAGGLTAEELVSVSGNQVPGPEVPR
jgi:GrpB-like predicted nucleotidyltransferase (UPF0157 family)